MDAVECSVLTNGRMVQFECGPSQTCCGSQCCPAGGPFYTHWYFWLAMCMFLMVVLGFMISACRHFRKERKLQQCCMRTKREIGSDLLLNYHLMRTDLLHLPLYDNASTSHQCHVGPLIYTSSTLLPSPPPYTLTHNDDINTGHTPAEHHDQPPPSYTQCLQQDGSHSVLSPPTDGTSRTESHRLRHSADDV
ncbi:uncharacterized protein [Littorina saxatilis]